MTAGLPLTSPDAMKAQVTEGFAAAAAAYDADGAEFFGPMGERLVAHAGIKPGAIILDVGCGKGAVTIPAARAAGPGRHVTGIDLAGPMLDHARLAAAEAGLANVTFGPGDAEDPPFPAGSFNVILAGNLIQFLPRPTQAARRWWSLLAAGGTLAMSWGVAQEARWVPVMAAIDAYVPDGVPAFGALLRRPPFHDIVAVEDMLRMCGFFAVATVTHDITMTYGSPEQWWATCQSQAPWAVSWRHIPAGRLPDAKRDVFTLLDQMRETGGTLTRTVTFACTSGHKEA